jgi:hypothetical protein
MNVENGWFIFLRIQHERPICLKQQVPLLLYLCYQSLYRSSKVFPEHLLLHPKFGSVILLLKFKNFDQFSGPLIYLVLSLVLCDLDLTLFLLSYPLPFSLFFPFLLFNESPLRLEFINVHGKQRYSVCRI